MEIDYTDLTDDQKVFYYWIAEREKCRVGRETGAPKPWSNDPILQTYRFCNVRREDDIVTKWIHSNWIEPFDCNVNSEHMVFAMCVARLFNRITTLQLIGFPGSFTNDFRPWLENTRAVLKQARAKGEKIWTGAYLVSTNGHSMVKLDYVLDKVLVPIANRCEGPSPGDTLESYYKHLIQFDGLGSFMAGQVIADLKFTSHFIPNVTSDWWTWAPIGPGSRRGLNRYFGRNLEGSIKTEQVLMELNSVQWQVQQRLGIKLAVHNIQNCFCEYDKMLRVKKGEGKPRSLYNGRK